LIAIALCVARVWAGQTLTHPYTGITLIARTETSPRALSMHIAIVDLTAPGIGFKLTDPGGTRETVRQTTLDFLHEERAQLAINSHFFLPFPSREPDAMLIGLAASNGSVYSAFETPVQAYALVADAPALNIDAANRAQIVHRDPDQKDGRHVRENVTLWNAVSGSAQIVTNGKKTIPAYRDRRHPTGALTPGGREKYSNRKSWYRVKTARTVIALARDNQQLILFTVDKSARSKGMRPDEIADLLIRDYRADSAINLDGGGSTTMAMQDPETRQGRLLNVPSGRRPRAVGSNLAVFAR
jgi:exopolysaccharide biosynthesis protein